MKPRRKKLLKQSSSESWDQVFKSMIVRVTFYTYVGNDINEGECEDLH